MIGRALVRFSRPLRRISTSVSNSNDVARRCFATTCRLRRRDPHDIVEANEKRVILSQTEIFDEMGRLQKSKDKLAFMKALQLYEQKQSLHRRGHVEFIYAAMSRMEEFGVQKDLSVYKALFDIFPKKVMVAVNVWQAEMMHYPKQQDCALDILQKMENYGIVPDDQTGNIIVSTFGPKSHVMRKYQRMMYWMPKFKHMNPYPVPADLPSNLADLAVVALKRMSVDPENKITVFKVTDESLAGTQDRFIASAQSPEQAVLLTQQPESVPLYVDGPHTVWLRDKHLKYFVLQTDGLQSASEPVVAQDDDSWLDTLDSSWTSEDGANTSAVQKSSIHQQPNGTILAMCIPWLAQKDALQIWLNMLQAENPHLSRLAVVLKLRSTGDDGATCEELLHQRLLDASKE